MRGLQPGEVFARDFRVLRPLSEGGMGALWVVEQLSTGKQRALKLLHADMQGDEARRRFEQEARIGARIASEHVVEVIAAGVEGSGDRPWLVMELLEGEELAARVEREGALPVEEATDVLRQLAHGLAAAHDMSIVHRDLKPENIFLAASRLADRPFLVKILDFGIAKVTAGNVSATGAIGTPLWMAPEQTDPNGRVTLAADVWAYGLLAFYVLSGRYYWRAAAVEPITPAQLMRELLLDPLPPPSARASEVRGAPLPDGFDAWFASCVTRDPAARFAHARDAWSALAPILGVTPSSRVSLGTTAPSRPRVREDAATELAPGASSGRRLPTGAAVTVPKTDGFTPRTGRRTLAAAGTLSVALFVGGAILFARSVGTPRPDVRAVASMEPAAPSPAEGSADAGAVALDPPRTILAAVDAGSPARAATASSSSSRAPARGTPARPAASAPRPAAQAAPTRPHASPTTPLPELL